MIVMVKQSSIGGKKCGFLNDDIDNCLDMSLIITFRAILILIGGLPSSSGGETRSTVPRDKKRLTQSQL